MAKKNFDPDKYLASVHQVSDEQHAALMAEARREALSMRPSQLWLRACESLVVGVLIGAAIGWLAGWSLLSTLIVIGFVVALALRASGLTLLALQRRPAD